MMFNAKVVSNFICDDDTFDNSKVILVFELDKTHSKEIQTLLYIKTSQNDFFIQMIFWMIFPTCNEKFLELPQELLFS